MNVFIVLMLLAILGCLGYIIVNLEDIMTVLRLMDVAC